MTLKIVHLSHRFWPCLGGIETHIRELCDFLQRKGFTSSVVCLNKCPNSKTDLPPHEIFEGIDVNRLSFIDLGIYRIAPGVLGKIEDFDVVHVHGIGFFSDFLALTKPFHKKKLVLSSHGAIFHTNNFSLLKKLHFFGLGRLTLRMYDKVIAVSKTDLALFKKVVPGKKLALIENPIDVKRLRAAGGNVDGKTVLFVGRLSKNKGLFNLLEAFKVAAEREPYAKLIIAGKEFDLSIEDLREKAKELGISGKVNVLGAVSEKKLAELFGKSDIFASASKYEGFGISAVEAMAAGLIPVLNTIPTFRDFIRHGENGFVVDFSDVERAGRTILRVLELSPAERKKMSMYATQFAQRFSWESSIEKFENVYKECTGSRD